VVNPNAYYQPQMYASPYPTAAYQSPYYASPASYYPPPPSVMQPQYNKKLNVSVTPYGSNKAVVLHNVELPEEVDVKSSTMAFQRSIVPNEKGQMPFLFKPDGKEHLVSVTNYGVPVHNFRLKPQPLTVRLSKSGDNKIYVDNAYVKENVQLSSDKPIEWSLTPSSNPHSYILQFDAHGQVANIELSSVIGGQKVPAKNGKIVLAPKNRASSAPRVMANPMVPAAQPHNPYSMLAAPNYPPPASYAYPPQPPMYYAPVNGMYPPIQGPPRY
jgi:hypothetical protein